MQPWLTNTESSCINVKKFAIKEFVDIVFEGSKEDLKGNGCIPADLANRLTAGVISYTSDINKRFGQNIAYEGMEMDINLYAFEKITSNLGYFLDGESSSES